MAVRGVASRRAPPAIRVDAAGDGVAGSSASLDPRPTQAGATWWLPEFPPEETSVDQVRGVLRDEPLAPCGCVFHFDGDRLIKETRYFDHLTLMQQIGALS